MSKLIPFGMSFEHALRAGYVGRIENRGYLDWIKALPCDTCGAPPPSDPSHINSWKGMGTKAPDYFSIPQCRECHEQYEQTNGLVEPFMARVALYLLYAIISGVLRP